jgi:hypothetical protein
MADLAHQHIPCAHFRETGRDASPDGCWGRPRPGSISIYDRRGPVFHNPAPANPVMPADALAGATPIKIG